MQPVFEFCYSVHHTDQYACLFSHRLTQNRVPELPPWTERRFEVSGVSWDVNSMDIAVSGLGWYSLGLKGIVTVAFWTLEGIHVTGDDPAPSPVSRKAWVLVTNSHC
jgi:hypothetical protein